MASGGASPYKTLLSAPFPPSPEQLPLANVITKFFNIKLDFLNSVKSNRLDCVYGANKNDSPK